MKAVKIILLILAVGGIGFVLLKFASQSSTGVAPTIATGSENQFVNKIEQQIDSLKQAPNDKLSNQLYKEIAYYINEDYKNGNLDTDPSRNEQLKDVLSSNLYTAYSEKFIAQARHALRKDEWHAANLQIISSEIKKLKASPYLGGSSATLSSLNEFEAAINKYYEINRFITVCKRFQFTETGLFSNYPIAEAERLIQESKSYLQHNMENNYVAHCSNLKNELRSIPEWMFTEHVRYLTSKINAWRGMYENYNTQKDYADNLFYPLKKEVDALDNEIYNVSNFSSEYERLITMLKNDSKKAYDYFSE